MAAYLSSRSDLWLAEQTGSHICRTKSQPGRSLNLTGHQPTHSPARPMPIPGQRPDWLAPEALCARIVTALRVLAPRSGCCARSDWSAAALSLPGQHHRLSLLILLGVFGPMPVIIPLRTRAQYSSHNPCQLQALRAYSQGRGKPPSH